MLFLLLGVESAGVRKSLIFRCNIYYSQNILESCSANQSYSNTDGLLALFRLVEEGTGSLV